MDMNKLPPGVREALRERGRKEAEVAIMTPREVFEDYCTWNGIINWSDTLWDTMQALVQAQPAPVKRPAGAEFSVDEMGFMQLADTKVLSAAARGLVDLNREARENLVNRGLDANGQWVGFDKARILMSQACDMVPLGVPFPPTHSPEKLAEVQGFPTPASDVKMQFESPRCMGVTKPLKGDAGAPMPKADGEPKKVVVMLTGGIVDEVLVGDEGVPVSVAVIDIDKNADLDDLVVIPEPDGSNTYALAAIHTATVNPARVNELHAAVEEGMPAAEYEGSLRP